jgi:hypothetical protein
MKWHFLHRWLRLGNHHNAGRNNRRKKQAPRPTCLLVEPLEQRQLLTTVQFNAAVFTARETDAMAPITVTLDAPSSLPVTVQYNTSDGTATAGNGYLATGGTLTFAPGEVEATFTVPVLNAIPDRANGEGDAVSLQVTATSPDGAPLTFSAQGLPAGLGIDASTGLISGTVAANAAAAVAYRVTVTAADGTYSASAAFTWAIAASAPDLVGVEFDADAGEDFAGPLAVFTDAVAPALAAGDRAVIDWGDQQSSAGSVVPQPDGTFAVFGHHTYAAAGTFAVRVTLTTVLAQVVTATLVHTAAAADPEPDGWTFPDSPFFARSLLEAKYRAWIQTPQGTADASPVGPEVAEEFGVAADTPWGQFFSTDAAARLRQDRDRAAARLDPTVLVRLHGDWTKARQQAGYQHFAPIGEEVAARWKDVPGFEWVQPETGWQELYTMSAWRRYRELVAVPIPRMTEEARPLGRGGIDLRAYAAANPIRFLSEEDGNALLWVRRLQRDILPRLRYASPEEIAQYVQGLDTLDRMRLRIALDAAIPAASGLGRRFFSSTPVVPPDPETQLLYEQLNAELVHDGDRSAYGLHDLNATSFDTVFDALQSPSSTQLDRVINRGTYAQRLAFLADTDYATFLAREQAFKNRELADDERSPDGYYRVRGRLIEMVRQALRSGTSFRELEIAIRNDRLMVNYPNLARTLFDNYLRGADAARLSGTAYYVQDRYFQANTAFGLLPGWQQASRERKEAFADSLLPQDRDVLLFSLAQAAQSLRQAGIDGLAGAAAEMAHFIQSRFDAQLKLVEGREANPTLADAFRAASRASRVRDGFSSLTDSQRQAFASLPRSLQYLADARAMDAFWAWRKANPVVIKYQPAFWFEAADRFVLNMAEFLAPAYHTGERIIGLGQLVATGDATRTDLLSNLDAIRRVMDGDFSASTRPEAISYSAGAIIWDGIQTGLMIIPAGSGSRAAISGGRFVPFGAGLSRAQILRLAGNQVLSGTRHGIVLAGATGFSSAAMTAVEVSPLEAQYKTPLRFVAGLVAGVASGAYLNKKLPQIGHYLVKKTQELDHLSRQLNQVGKDIAAARAAGRPVAELTRQEQALTAQVAEVRQQVQRLRELGGQALVDAEEAYNTVQRRLSDLQAKANAEGLSPLRRAQLRSGAQMREAQEALRAAEQRLGKVLAEIDKAAVARGLVRPAPLLGYATLPARGRLLGRGSEGRVFEIPGHPEWVLKELYLISA